MHTRQPTEAETRAIRHLMAVSEQLLYTGMLQRGDAAILADFKATFENMVHDDVTQLDCTDIIPAPMDDEDADGARLEKDC